MMADTETQPLSAAEIEAIDQRYWENTASAEQWAEIMNRGLEAGAHYDENDAPFVVVRLLATLNAYREIVEAVAKAKPACDDGTEYCLFCESQEYLANQEFHSDDCPVTRSRRLLDSPGNT